MRIISIDPGYERLGIATLERKNGEKESLLFSECFQTKSKDTHAKRLGEIHDEIKRIITEYKPSKLAIETLFFNNNQKTALLVAEARGTVISLCSSMHLEVYEFSPQQIKVAVTGNGKSDKNGIIKMIPLLIKINKKIKHDDEYDAIATGLAFFATNILK